MAQVVQEVHLGPVFRRVLEVLRRRGIPMLLVSFVAAMLVLPVYYGVSNTLYFDLQAPVPRVVDDFLFWACYIVLAIPVTVFLTRLTLDSLGGTQSDAEQHLDDFRRHYFPVLVIWLLTGFGYPLTYSLAPRDSMLASVAFTFLTMWVALAGTLRVAENTSILHSLINNVRLVRGNMRAVFGFTVVLEVVHWGLVLLVRPDFFRMDQPFNPVVTWFLGPVSDAVGITVETVGWTVLYAALRAANGESLESPVAKVFD